LEIGTNVQAYDALLSALAALTTAANKLIYATGSDTFSTTDLTSFARQILDDANAAAVLATIGAPSLTANNTFSGQQIVNSTLWVTANADPVMRSLAGDTFRRALLLAGVASQVAHIFEVRTGGVSGTIVLAVSENGFLKIGKQAAPADAEIDNGEFALYWDPTTGVVSAKGKNGSGTVLTGTLGTLT
jgi:hypothetical protein